jgi:hypothetical protein
MTLPAEPVPTRPANFDNLMRVGSLMEGIYSKEDVAQYVVNAEHMLADAELPGISVHGSFTLAYEGLHCLAVAILNYYRVRAVEGRGHRTTALQLLPSCLSLKEAVPGADIIVTRAHERRNNTTYNRPVPPIPAGDARALVALLKAAVPKAKALLKP